MNEELLSKKELLEITGISYGSLYRWKRKNLIPEEWFIRKSTFTGQETFFPKNKILERIDRIKNLKEDLSLDSLAEVFTPNLGTLKISAEEISKKGLIQKSSLDFYGQMRGKFKTLSFDNLLFLFVFDEMLQSGNVNLEECKIALITLEEQYKGFEGKNCVLFLCRKAGIATCFLASSPVTIRFDHETKVIIHLDLYERIEKLKIKLQE
ncbi:MAG: YhbD family protein [Caldisericia bacterium]|nr:YhbD family protein [Caldisericia bacterium]